VDSITVPHVLAGVKVQSPVKASGVEDYVRRLAESGNVRKETSDDTFNQTLRDAGMNSHMASMLVAPLVSNVRSWLKLAASRN